jgi:hypothetical protein
MAINRITMNFNSGQEFNFVQCNSLYESKSKIRTRPQDPEELKTHFISLLIEKFMLYATLGEDTRTMIEFERLAINYSFRRV